MKKLVTLALVLAASSAFAAPGNGNGNKSTGGCAAVLVGSDQIAAGEYGTSFSATKIIDLDFSMLFAPESGLKFKGTHVLELRVFTPNGHLYESTAFPFSAEAAKKGGKEKIDRYPLPLPVEVLSETTYAKGKYLLVKSRVPVAGTPIVNNSLYGEWRAEAYLDDELLPCSIPATFTLGQ
jgi:hypothetical protein